MKPQIRSNGWRRSYEARDKKRMAEKRPKRRGMVPHSSFSLLSFSPLFPPSTPSAARGKSNLTHALSHRNISRTHAM